MTTPPEFDPDGPAGDGLYGLPFRPEEARVVVVPVPFEATTSYGRGTARAPARILEASKQVDLHDAHTGDAWRDGIALAPPDPDFAAWNEAACADAIPVIEAGGADTPELAAALARVNAIGDRLNERVYAHTKAILDRGAIPAILGGDHSVPFGAMKAAIERWPDLGVLHVDAHADLREAYEGFTWSHASIFHNVVTRLPLRRLVQVGIRDFGAKEAAFQEKSDILTCVTDHEIAWELGAGESWLRVAARIVRPLPRRVWVSFDIDGLDPELCPNTGTPVPGGLRWRDALMLLQLLAEEHEIVGFDLVEVGDGEWDANVGARLLYKLAGHAIRTHVPRARTR